MQKGNVCRAPWNFSFDKSHIHNLFTLTTQPWYGCISWLEPQKTHWLTCLALGKIQKDRLLLWQPGRSYHRDSNGFLGCAGCNIWPNEISLPFLLFSVAFLALYGPIPVKFSLIRFWNKCYSWSNFYFKWVGHKYFSNPALVLSLNILWSIDFCIADSWLGLLTRANISATNIISFWVTFCYSAN